MTKPKIKTPAKSSKIKKQKKASTPAYVKRLESLLETVPKSSRAAAWASTILCALAEENEDAMVQVVTLLFKYVQQDTIKNGITRGGSLASLDTSWIGLCYDGSYTHHDDDRSVYGCEGFDW